MLTELLRLVASAKGSFATAGLAQALETSDAMVGAMMDELVRLGYLEPVQAGCEAGGCAHCPQAGGCGSGPAIRLWNLTEKGRRLAGK